MMKIQQEIIFKKLAEYYFHPVKIQKIIYIIHIIYPTQNIKVDELIL